MAVVHVQEQTATPRPEPLESDKEEDGEIEELEEIKEQAKEPTMKNKENDDEEDVDQRRLALVPSPKKSPKVIQVPELKRGVNAYIPPAKRKQMQPPPHDEERTNESEASVARWLLQRQQDTWRDQQRVIHGTINRLNAQTIKPLIQQLFQKVNLIRMKGVFCKSTLAAALSSPKYANVYASLIAVVNCKLPEVGELVVHRAILAFRRHYQRREKGECQAVCVFLAHLFHQAVVHELLILQLLSLLLDGDATDDSVEIAVELLQTTGQALLEVSAPGVRACLDRLRNLLSEGLVQNKKVQHKMELLLKMRKNGFRDFPPISEDLDLVERDDQITHETSLDDQDIQKEEQLDAFQESPDFEEVEKEWAGIRAEILGEGGSSDSSDADNDDGSTASSGSDNDYEDNDKAEPSEVPGQQLATTTQSRELTVVQDLTEQDLIHLRRTIYLTIMSSATFEECAHKLARIDIPQGREMELVNMLIECCSQERTFLRYYGLIASRFCVMADRWRDTFMESFKEQYATIHRLETNKLRNVAKLFAHILHTDAVPWSVLETIHLNEDETTSSSRIFIKIVIQEMAEAMGIAKLKARFEAKEKDHKLWYAGMFPMDNVRNTRYAINFFTSIGLGPLTDDLREFLKNAPKLILAKAKEAALAKKGDDSDSSSVTSSSSSGTSSSSSSSGSSSSDSRSAYSSKRYSSRSSESSSSSSSYSSRRRRPSSKRRRGRRSRSSSSSSSSSSSTGSSSSGDSRRGRDKGDRRLRDRRSRSRSLSPPADVIKPVDAVEIKKTSSKSRREGGRRPQRGHSSSSSRGRKRTEDARSPSPERRKRQRSPSTSSDRSDPRSRADARGHGREEDESDIRRKDSGKTSNDRSKRRKRRYSPSHSRSSSSTSRQ